MEPKIAIFVSLLQDAQKYNTYFVLLMSKTPFTFEKLLIQKKNVTWKIDRQNNPEEFWLSIILLLKLIKQCL
jgi:hypothetical protein